MSCAVFTLLAFYAALTNRSNHWIVASMAIAAALLLLIGAIGAGLDEYRAKVRGPDLLLTWKSQKGGRDEITFRNTGTGDALEARTEEFSRGDLSWMYTIEIPVVPANESRTVPAEFSRAAGDKSFEIGYLFRILESMPEDEPLWLWISYRNARGTRYRRRFLLRLVNAGCEREVSCRPEKLRVAR